MVDDDAELIGAEFENAGTVRNGQQVGSSTGENRVEVGSDPAVVARFAQLDGGAVAVIGQRSFDEDRPLAVRCWRVHEFAFATTAVCWTRSEDHSGTRPAVRRMEKV